MDRIEATTVIHRPPDVVFEFLSDFTSYAGHSRYLESVDCLESAETPRYDLHFSWWRLSYTARSRVTALDPPETIQWELVRDLDAAGQWMIKPTQPEGDQAPITNGGFLASDVRFIVEYDPKSVTRDRLDIPRLVPTDWVVDRAVDLALEEAERVVRSIVSELEGRERPVDLTLRRSTGVSDPGLNDDGSER